MSPDWPVFRFTEIDSTNTEARRRAGAGKPVDQWIVADSQAAGRGRLDRKWLSPRGNIYATALFAEPGGIRIALRIPFAAALGVLDTIQHFAPSAPCRVKWPNDVRVAGEKISGILVETTGSGDDLIVAAGIGLNVRHAPDGTGQPATCLDALSGMSLDCGEVFTYLARRFVARLEMAREGFDRLRLDWLARAEGLGERVRVRAGEKESTGIFEGLETDGAMRLRLPDGHCRIIRAGEVNLIGRY